MELNVGPNHMKFTRKGPKGSVLVEWQTPEGGWNSITVDAGTWCSLVCTVSAHGEENGRWYQAGTFHNGSAAVTNELD